MANEVVRVALGNEDERGNPLKELTRHKTKAKDDTAFTYTSHSHSRKS